MCIVHRRYDPLALIPGARSDLESCMRTLMVSRGCHASYKYEKKNRTERSLGFDRVGPSMLLNFIPF